MIEDPMAGDPAFADESGPDAGRAADGTADGTANGTANGTADGTANGTANDIMTEARRAIEAMLLVASEPTAEHLLAQVVELPAETVRGICENLVASYEADQRGFQLIEVAGGWRYQTHPDVHAYVERYAMEGLPNRLSSAALETLAIVAYKQPISRVQVGAIRGVNADGVLKTLEQRGYIAEVGRDNGPGQATLFGTTDFFLERLELATVEELPPLGDFIPSADVLEALEQTLRIDPEPPEAGEGEHPTDVTATTEPAAVDPDGDVDADIEIDLRDPAVSDVIDLEASEYDQDHDTVDDRSG